MRENGNGKTGKTHRNAISEFSQQMTSGKSLQRHQPQIDSTKLRLISQNGAVTFLQSEKINICTLWTYVSLYRAHLSIVLVYISIVLLKQYIWSIFNETQWLTYQEVSNKYSAVYHFTISLVEQGVSLHNSRLDYFIASRNSRNSTQFSDAYSFFRYSCHNLCIYKRKYNVDI